MIKNKIKNFITKNYKIILLCAVISVIGHSYFLKNQILNDQYMMGSADQFSQMIIFKDLLYEEFSKGNFFYSFFLNGGTNLISRLSYYYSTSLFFYGTALVTFLLETFRIITAPSMVYWASISVFISVVRTFIVLLVTTKYINIFVNDRKISLLGASFYALSSIYFRHTTLWEFFGDAMVWLPIILLGVEYIIRKSDGKIFSLGIALTMFNNGYFAFANLFFAFIYIILRMLFNLSYNEEKWLTQIKNYIIYGLIGVGLSLPGFIPFVIGFFSTSRLSPEFSIPIAEFIDFSLGDLLLKDQIQLLPILFIIVITYLLNYKSKNFKFFSILSFVLIILRYNTFVASLFNGLSYPQFRWHYITFLMIAIVVGLGVKNIIKDLTSGSKKSIIFLGISAFITFSGYYLADKQLNEHYFKMNLLYSLILVSYLIFFFVNIKKIKIRNLLVSILFFSSLYTVFVSNRQLYYDYSLYTMNYDKVYNTFDNPNTNFEQALDLIEADSSDCFYRLDFSDMDNFGSQKKFSSFNVYTSFQNRYQQYFYRYFQIINSKENNGVIDGLAGRQNLNSIFQSNYVIAPKTDQYIIPSGFEEIGEEGDLTVYKNQIPLAFIHPVHNLYSSEEVAYHDYKDNLIIDGAIVPQELSNTNVKNYNMSSVNEIDYTVTEVETKVSGTQLMQSDNYFDIKINLQEQNIKYDDLVIDYTIKPSDSGERGRYTYSLNGYSIQLKSTGGPYSSQLYRHQAHLPYKDEIIFNLAPGTNYIFDIHSIYGVSHNELIERGQRDLELEYDIQIDGGEVDIYFNNKDDYPLMVLPLFYEPGWEIQINGENQEVLNVNNGMIGFEIPSDELNIQLEFNQPFLEETLLIAILSLTVLVYLDKKKV